MNRPTNSTMLQLTGTHSAVAYQILTQFNTVRLIFIRLHALDWIIMLEILRFLYFGLLA